MRKPRTARARVTPKLREDVVIDRLGRPRQRGKVVNETNIGTKAWRKQETKRLEKLYEQEREEERLGRESLGRMKPYSIPKGYTPAHEEPVVLVPIDEGTAYRIMRDDPEADIYINDDELVPRIKPYSQPRTRRRSTPR